KPQTPFTMSSAVSEALGYFVGTSGVRRAIIAHPRILAGRTMAGLLASSGYEADNATNARQAVLLATHSPGCAFALLHVSLADPGVDERVKQLRRDARTAQLPIGLVTTPDDLERIERFAHTVTFCMALPEPQAPEVARGQADQLTALLGRNF